MSSNGKKPDAQPPRPLRRGRFGAFLRRQDGATAVEFALIAAPFIALLMAVFEVGLVFLAQEQLQSAVSDASRLILTEQAQNGSMTASQFQAKVCSLAGSLFNCSNLYVNVQKFSTFTNVSPMNPVANNNFVNTGMTYSPGSNGDIVLVQAFYPWPVFTAPLSFNYSNVSGSSRLLTASAAFRNEPQ